MKNLSILILITLNLQFATVFAQYQHKIDSLKQVIATEKVDTNLIETLFMLGDEYEYSNYDSSLIYFNDALLISEKIKSNSYKAISLVHIGMVYFYKNNYDTAIVYFKKSTVEFKLAQDTKGVAMNYRKIGVIYSYNGIYKQALDYLQKSLIVYEGLGDKAGIASSLGDMGNIYVDQGNYDKALEVFQNALNIHEELENKEGIVVNLVSIGNVYADEVNNKKALEYYKKAMKINEELGDKNLIAALSCNIGIIYFDQNNNKEALACYQKSLDINKELDDKGGIARDLGNIGIVYSRLEEFDKAFDYYQKALEINEKIGNKYGIAANLGNFAELNNKLKKYKKAIYYANKSLDLTKEIGALKREREAYLYLSSAYKGLKQYQNALKYKELWISINDSIFTSEKTKVIAEMGTRYETEKKEKQIIEQQAELKTSQLQIEKEKAEKEKQQTQRNLFIIAFGLTVILVVFVFRSYSQKKRANILLAEQKHEIAEANEELNQQNEEITAQRNEIESQRDIVVKQKEKIEKNHYEISESIDYATRLQGSILPEEKVLDKHLSEHFVLFKPKDKVSGDFYWWSHIENHTVITAADSTGHGVPGAFMSMLGSSFLREIVQKEYITHTGVILRKLRKEIIKALKQKGELGEQKDGMDMAIISIDHKTNIVQFSGANNPLYILTNRKLNDLEPLKDFENFYEIKPDKMPIAIYVKMGNFTTHEIQLEKGDQLYMFSDGYADQFGGTKRKKFKYKPFKRLLSENRDKPMKEQKELLDTAFEVWKGNIEQIDDVVVLGIKI